MLAHVAKTDADANARKAAVARLTNQAALAKIAKTDEDQLICEDALSRLTDQGALADVAQHAKWGAVRLKSVGKLTDQNALTRLARENAYPYVRNAAVEKLTDPALLAAAKRHANRAETDDRHLEGQLASKRAEWMRTVRDDNAGNEKRLEALRSILRNLRMFAPKGDTAPTQTAHRGLSLKQVVESIAKETDSLSSGRLSLPEEGCILLEATDKTREYECRYWRNGEDEYSTFSKVVRTP